MEYLDGTTLKHRMAAGRWRSELLLGSPSRLRTPGCGSPQGIIHRDIKPANIFVTKRGHAKVLDFGLAKVTSERRVTCKFERSRTGDYEREAPDQSGTVLERLPICRRNRCRAKELDARTDLFSFGAVLYEMATGTLPFRGESTGLVFKGILNRCRCHRCG